MKIKSVFSAAILTAVLCISGNVFAVLSGGGTGKTTAEMKTQSTFTDAGWDFTNIWWMPANSYPQLGREQLFPMQVGQKYVYRQSDPLNNNWTVELIISGQTMINSVVYFHLQNFNYYNESVWNDLGFLRSTADYLYAYNPDGDEYLDFQKGVVGTKWNLYRPDEEYNYDVREIVSIESVTVPYGTFDEAYKFRNYACVDPKNLSLGQSPSWYEWIVPGVGFVKEEDYWTDGPAPVIQELTGITFIGDINNDGVVNFVDYAIFASAWKTQPGQPNWNPACDFSYPQNNIIDCYDLDLFADNWLDGNNISDHVFNMSIETGWDYGAPDDSNDDSYEFEFHIMTDGTVQEIQVQIPGGDLFTIPKTLPELIYTSKGHIEKGCEYDSDENVFDWSYLEAFNKSDDLSIYGDGSYTVKMLLGDGSIYKTTLWFGIPGTSDPIPQPTQKPTYTSFSNGDTLTSPVMLKWAACIDPGLYVIGASATNTDTWEDLLDTELPGNATELDELLYLSNGNYEIDLSFDADYSTINADGIPIELQKWCESDYVITVAGNTAPVVNAGSDQLITLPTTSANLDGSVTDDGLPNPPAVVTVTWTKQSGPGTVTFGNANAVDTTANFSVAGTYVLRLSATDSELVAYDEVTITVADDSLDAMWTWVSGSNSTSQFGVYGTKGVAAPGNVPGRRSLSVSWIDGSGNLWLFGGSSRDDRRYSLNDLWKFDGTNWTWVSGSNTTSQFGVYGTKGVTAPGNVPGARYGSVSWIDGSDNLWLFGGYGYAASGSSGNLNDLWEFDGTNWTWVSGSNTTDQLGVYGTKGVAAPGNVPGARQFIVSWIDNGGNMWLFGGFGYAASGSINALNDLWKFDGTNWTWINGSSAGGQYGVYGTKGVAAPGNVPGARDASVSWKDTGGNLWLFGGYGNVSGIGSGTLNDLWKFDGTNWIWVSGSNTVNQYGFYGTKGVTASGNVPGARQQSVSWIDANGNLWLFGGLGYAASDSNYLNDLWKFDGTNWTWVSGSNDIYQAGVYGTKGVAAASNVPGARGSSESWIDSNGNLWLFGGGGYAASGGRGKLNDLWKFGLP